MVSALSAQGTSAARSAASWCVTKEAAVADEFDDWHLSNALCTLREGTLLVDPVHESLSGNFL
jgi:hypothetical protein